MRTKLLFGILTLLFITITARNQVAAQTQVCEGQSVTLTGTTDGTERQWYKKYNGTDTWEIIPNATDVTYTIPNATTDLDNCQYIMYYRTCLLDVCTPYSTTSIETLDVISTPAPGVTNISYCQGATASPLTATGTDLKWYTTATGGTGTTTAPTPSTAVIGITSYYVSQTANGCEGPRAKLDVEIKVNQWIGGVPGSETDWHTASNWCGGVPGSSSAIEVPGNTGSMPVINNATIAAEVYNLSLAPGATLAVNSGLLKVYGNLSSAGVLLTKSSTTVSMNGSQVQTISGKDLSFETLEINNSSGVLLNDSITIKNKLVFNQGKLNISNHKITFAAQAAIVNSSTSSYIISDGMGFIKRVLDNTHLQQEVLFPLGDTQQYTPLIFTLTRAALSGDEAVLASVKVEPTGHNKLHWDKASDPSNPVYLKRVWILHPEGTGLNQAAGADFAYGIKVNYMQQDLYANEASREGELVLGKFSSEEWKVEGGVVDTTNNILSATNFSSFSDFTGAELGMYNAISNLPVTLLSFKAQPRNEHVELTWTTSNETNNKLFTVERSLNGTSYEAVLEQSGAGNSSQAIYYKAIDRHPVEGLSYYRLKQTNFDGSSTYSTAVMVNFKGSTVPVLLPYPNPNSGTTVNLLINGMKGQPASLKIIDIVGKVILTQNQLITESNYELYLDFATKLKAGAYTIVLNSNKTVLTKKLVVH